ncbi:MAG: glycine cleavage system protein GcvH [Dehalococcoidia bacterium]|nr:glycine cleavage system protein GcvH [Dehalococcoidia bacterium]
MVPSDLKYVESHEWVRIADNTVVIGITDYAQDKLGDVVFVELPSVGTNLTQGGKLGDIESVKAASELFSPLSGEVVEVNGELLDHPEMVNRSPYEGGWMIRLRLKDRGEVDKLLSAEKYEAGLE